jgi:hypothetical protein
MLVGEANPATGDPAMALLPVPRGGAGARLATMIGLTDCEYLGTFYRANLCDVRWDRRAASDKAAVIARLSGALQFDVVMLGARVAAAFGLSRLGPWERSERFIHVPHPSGRCRTWNDARQRERLRVLMLEYRR